MNSMKKVSILSENFFEGEPIHELWKHMQWRRSRDSGVGAARMESCVLRRDGTVPRRRPSTAVRSDASPASASASLMGFPDDHTRIAWKGRPEEECPDAPRYKACGNSMCVNVMTWLGHRIQKVEESLASREAKLITPVTCFQGVAVRTCL